MSTHRRQLQGAALVILSGLTLSTKAVLAKLAYRHGIDALTMLTLRMLFAAPFLVLSAYLAERNAPSRIRSRDLGWLILLGITGYHVSSLLDFWGLTYISAALERLVLYLYPTFVLLLSAGLSRTRLRRDHALALTISYAGMGVAFQGESELAGGAFSQGSLMVLGCSIGYAVYLVGAGQLIPRIGAQRFTAYSLLAATGSIFFHWLFCGRPLGALPLEVYGYGFLMATLSTVIPLSLLSKGISLVGAGPAAILTSIGPVSTILLAYLLLQEPITLRQCLGGVLVLIGVTWVSLARRDIAAAVQPAPGEKC